MSGWLNGNSTFLTSGGSATTAIADPSSHSTRTPLVWDGSKWIDAALTPQGIVDEINPAGAYEGYLGRFQNGNIGALSTGVMTVCPIWLPAGTTVSNLLVYSATTAMVTGTHQFNALYTNYTDATGANSLLVGYSADGLATAWGSNTKRDLPIAFNGAGGAASNYVTTVDDWYGVGCMVAAATVPSLRGESWGAVAFGAGTITGQLVVAKTVGVGLTFPPPANLSGFANSANSMYVAVH